MVTRQSIRRLADDVDDLELRLGAPVARRWLVPFIRYPSCLDKDAVIARHFELFPDEKGAELVVVTEIEIRTTIDELRGYVSKGDQAWRSIAGKINHHVDH